MLAKTNKGFDGSIKISAPNRAIASLFHAERHRRGVAESERSAQLQ